MNSAISGPDILNFLGKHLGSVFETMLMMPASPTDNLQPAELGGEHVTGCVGLAGESLTGSVYLHVSAPFAREAAVTMLGLPPEEFVAPSEVNDVVGEITNMLSGGLKSWLCDAGAVCKLTPPTVIRGQSYTVAPKPGVQLLQIGVDAGSSCGLIEVHFKLN